MDGEHGSVRQRKKNELQCPESQESNVQREKLEEEAHVVGQPTTRHPEETTQQEWRVDKGCLG